MKLVVQRVTRATVEVDGFVESRIGSGLVLSVALKKGSTRDQVTKLASQALKLKLWPETIDADKSFSSNVVDNGYEVLVLAQQSLCTSFPALAPNQNGAMLAAEAKVLYECFVEQLRKEYQEEMVVAAPFSADNMQVEVAQVGGGMFELDSNATATSTSPILPQAQVSAPLDPDVLAVSDALRKALKVPKNTTKAAEEANRIFQALSMVKFRNNLRYASPSEAETFSACVQVAGGHFTKKQQDQISAWTGLRIAAAPATHPQAATAKSTFAAIKQEKIETIKPIRRHDWIGSTAPTTPGGENTGNTRFAAPYGGGVGYKGGWKGRGRGVRSYGIASLDESARLHGSYGGYDYGQLSALPDAKLKVGPRGVKNELEQDGTTRSPVGGVLKRARGMPTVAPTCPATLEDENDDIWEQL